MTDERPTGVPADQVNVHIHLRGALLDRKLTALRAMATQTAADIGRLDQAIYTTQLAEEAFVDASPIMGHPGSCREYEDAVEATAVAVAPTRTSRPDRAGAADNLGRTSSGEGAAAPPGDEDQNGRGEQRRVAR